MAQVEWIKIKVDMFDDEKIRLIEALPEGDTLVVIWLKMLAHAGKINDRGYIYLKEGTPYTSQMLSIVYNRPQPVIDLALKTFQDFGMIEIDERGIWIRNWEKHQNIDGLERIRQQNRERKRRQRERERLALPPASEENEGESRDSHVTVTLGHATDIEEEKEKEKKETGGDGAGAPPSPPKKPDFKEQIQEVWEHYLKTFDGFFKRITLTDDRKTKIRARLADGFSVEEIKQAITNIRKSSFHCGENDSGKFYADITLICRSKSKLEEWINYNPKVVDMPRKPYTAEQARPNAASNQTVISPIALERERRRRERERAGGM